jgi:hypothetical protein
MSDDFEKDVKTELEPFEIKEEKEPHDTEIIEVDDNSPTIVQNFSQKQKELENDFEYVRSNMYNIIEKGTDALEELIHFAKASQSPRAFEVIAKLMDSISNSNEKIIDNYQKLKNINKSKDKDDKNNNQNAGTINNILFNGTTEQLFDAIESANKKKEK